MSLQRPSEPNPFAAIRLRTVLQRCKSAQVKVAGQSCGELESGLLALVGFSSQGETSPESAEDFTILTWDETHKRLEPLFSRWWDKVSQMRIFSDVQGKMNDSLLQQPGNAGVYLVSQFTLFADTRKGNRPSYTNALAAAKAKVCFEHLVAFVRNQSSQRPIYAGIFGADMAVSFVNDGPVTLIFDCSVADGVVSL